MNNILAIETTKELGLLFILILSFVVIAFTIILFSIQGYYRKRYDRMKEINLVTKTYNLKGFMRKIVANNKIKKWLFICLDISNFENILKHNNFSKDNLILRSVTNSINNSINHEGVIGNIGYSRFLIAIPYYRINQEIDIYINEFVTKNTIVSVDNISIELKYNVGAYVTTNDSLKHSIENTVSAWTFAKRYGKGIVIYNKDVVANNAKKKLIINDYKQAISDNRLKVVYTPVLNIKSGVVCQARVNYIYKLMDDTSVTEKTLLSSLEDNSELKNFILLILEKIANDLAKQRNIVSSLIPVSVKMNVSLFDDPDFIAKMNAIIYKVGITTDLIVVKFPMSEINDERFNHIIGLLKNNGYSVCVNDFLNSSVNFKNLINMDLNCVTLNKNVVEDNLNNQSSIKIVDGFTSLFKSTMPIIKGVDNGFVYEKLFNLENTVYATGTYFSSKMSIEDYLIYISKMPYTFYNNTFGTNATPVAFEKEEKKEEKKVEEVKEQKVEKEEKVVVKEEVKPNPMLEKSAIEEMIKEVINKNNYMAPPKEEAKPIIIEKRIEVEKQNNSEINLAEVLANTLNCIPQNNQIDDFLNFQPASEELEYPAKTELLKEEVKPEPVKVVTEVKEAKPIVKEIIREVIVNKDDDEEEDDDDEEEVESEEVSNAIKSKFDKIVDIDKFNALMKSYVEEYSKDEQREKVERTLLQKLSFVERIDQSSKVMKSYYNILKNKILEYDGMTNNVTKRYDIFKHNGVAHIKLTYVGITLKMYINLDPATYPYGQFPHKDVSKIKKYEKTPYLMKIRSDLGLKRAIILINDLMVNLELKAKPKYKNIDYVKLNNLAIQKLKAEN